MKVLIVEDNQSDRELLKIMLKSNYQHIIKFREVSSLKNAFSYLDRGDIDCVLLDLHLPDSHGKETFSKLHDYHTEIPIVVMTHNQDRDLAIELVRLGAADYVTKDYTDEEGIFQRILLAIERHKYTIRINPDDAACTHDVERARSDLMAAYKEGEPTAIQTGVVRTTAATAELTRRMFTEIQKLNTSLVVQSKDLSHITEITDQLQQEMLQGSRDVPSMKSKVERLEINVQKLEREVRVTKGSKT